MQPWQPMLGESARSIPKIAAAVMKVLRNVIDTENMLRKSGEYATQGENMLRNNGEYATQRENMLRNTKNMLRKKRQVTFSSKDCRANIGKVVKNMLRKISS